MKKIFTEKVILPKRELTKEEIEELYNNGKPLIKNHKKLK